MKPTFIFSTMLIAMLITIAIPSGLWSQAAPLSFRMENVRSYVPGPPPVTPWMFDIDDPLYNTDDGNPFTFKDDENDNSHNYAYYDFSSLFSTNYCTAENLDYVQGTDGFEVRFEDFELRGFHKINTVNPEAIWAIPGQAGDVRTYINGVSEIYYNDALVLRVEDCVLRVKVHYPSAAQMCQILNLEPGDWITEIGTGESTEINAWGTLDLQHSDPIWAATFTNFQAGNRVEFEMSSVDMVVQGQFGLYDFDLDIKKASFPIEQDHANILGTGEYNVQNLGFNYTAIEQGGPHGALNDLVVLEQGHEILMGVPEEVDEVHPKAWLLATTLESFTTDISFDLSGSGFGTSDQWVVLRKPENAQNWQIWPNVSYLSEDVIRANNVTAFSEWAIGKLGDDTLPVQLSSFTGTATSQGSVVLNWTTQSESNLIGFRIFRAETPYLDNSLMVGDLICASNSSNLTHYSFQDTESLPEHWYHYWLQVLDMDGNGSFHGPVRVLCTQLDTDVEIPPLDQITGIQSIYPNPGHHQTIKIYLERDQGISMDIYNLKGQKVKTIYRGGISMGQHNLDWDGTSDLGLDLPSGVYFVTFSSASGKTLAKRKISLVK